MKVFHAVLLQVWRYECGCSSNAMGTLLIRPTRESRKRGKGGREGGKEGREGGRKGREGRKGGEESERWRGSYY